MSNNPRPTDTPLPSGTVMRLRLVGQMEAWTAGGESLLPSGRKTRGVLAVVALSFPRPVLRGRLADMLWSRRPEEQARASLRQEIHRLNEALQPLGPEVLAVHRDHLALRPGAVWSDVDEVLRATAARPEGLSLFDGDLLEDLDGLDPAFDSWLAAERERIGDRARLLAEHLLREQTQPELVVAAAQRLIAIDRSHEGAWRALMRAYAIRGERGMAIQAFERCRTVLMDQLDALPSAETLRLGAELRATTPAAAPAATPFAMQTGAATAVAELTRTGRASTARAGGNGGNGPAIVPSRMLPSYQGADRIQTDRIQTNRIQADRIQADRVQADRVQADRVQTDRIQADRIQADRVQADRVQTDRIQADRIQADRIQANRIQAERGSGSPGSGERAANDRQAAGERPKAGGLAATRDQRDGRSQSRGGARVGVLPLRLLGTGADEANLATCLAEEITHALARFRWMSLVSSSALARAAAQQNRDEAALRRGFGLDFLVDGTIQRVGENLRVSLRLLDLGRSGQVAWSRRFDRPAADLLAIQDEIASAVSAQIDPEIMLIESQRLTSRPPPHPAAYDLLMRALPLLLRMDRPMFHGAGDLLTRAVNADPDYAPAHAWAAYWHVFEVLQGWSADPQASVAEAGRLADRAVTLDPQDARALTIAGHVRAFLHRRVREAMTLHDRALQLNPNLPMAWVLSAMTFVYVGDLDEAERRLAQYKLLNPLDPQAFFYDTARVVVALLRRDHAAAASLGREVTEMNPSFTPSQTLYLSALGHLGDHAEATRVRAGLLALEPASSVARFLATTALQREADRAHVAEGLRRAGL